MAGLVDILRMNPQLMKQLQQLLLGIPQLQANPGFENPMMTARQDSAQAMTNAALSFGVKPRRSSIQPVGQGGIRG